jgi:hypothetical protein
MKNLGRSPLAFSTNLLLSTTVLAITALKSQAPRTRSSTSVVSKPGDEVMWTPNLRYGLGRKIGEFRTRILLSHLAQSSGLRWRRQPQCPSSPLSPQMEYGAGGTGADEDHPRVDPKAKASRDGD